jgi:hypothetical protein
MLMRLKEDYERWVGKVFEEEYTRNNIFHSIITEFSPR